MIGLLPPRRLIFCGGGTSVGFTALPLPDHKLVYPRRRSGGGGPKSRSQIVPLSN